MKTIHLRYATARQATLVLILFLTGLHLQAQTPPPPQMTPAQARERMMQLRHQAATNGDDATPFMPAGTQTASPPSTATTGASTSGLPPTGLPSPGTLAGGPPGSTTTTAGPTGLPPAGNGIEVPGISYNYQGVDVNQVLDVYADLVGRTLLRAGLPQASIVLKTQSPLTKTEAIEALQAVLALNGIAVVNIGDKFVKVLPPQDANTAGAAFNNQEANQLPDLGSYVTHIVQLHYVRPTVMAPILAPFAKLQNAISAIDDNGILVIRDYAENVKRMLEMIDKIDVNVPAVYISEVIPIKYAQADDIANALNSLGGGGSGATVSVGTSAGNQRISGLAGGTGGLGAGGFGGANQAGYNAGGNQFGQPRTGLGAQGTTPGGAQPGTTPFQQRLMNIINRAGGGGQGGGQEQIQIFGQAKIIADVRANALLVFATRQDMDMIKHVISELDVLLSQVLIEAVIIDYSLGPNTLSLGVSAAQQPQFYYSSPPIGSGGGFNNGQQLFNLLQQRANLGNTNGVFGNGLGGGLNYFGNLGNYWNVAISAAAADSHASIIQTPRIQTSQAKPAQFFVGDTVPYVTSTYNYGGAYGNQSSYSQLSVGVELDVTPFINPDGLVVMQIAQEIDDLNGYTTITGVGQIPNTIKRTLNSEITVSNQDTVMLGGFIKNSKSNTRSGVPLLQDIPLLGNLFSQKNSSKQREELIVLMRPTVLKTPEIAAVNTVKQERMLPGASAAAAEDAADQAKLIDAERKKELKNPKTMSGGFYSSPYQMNSPGSQMPQPAPQNDGFFTPPPGSPGSTPPASQPPAKQLNNYDTSKPPPL
jgi:general secretion pathway protein D